MELQTEQLQRALQAVSGACNPRHNSEVLQHILLRASANGVQVVASDNEITAIAVVTPEGMRPQEILLPQKFIEILKQLNADTLRITADDTSLQLTSGGGRWRLATANPQDYPVWASPAGTAGLTLDHAELSDGLQSVAFCCDNESTRYALGAVRLERDPSGELDLVATDGRRLADRCIQTSAADTARIEALIPSKAVKVIRSMAAVGTVLLQADERNVYVTDQLGNRVIVRQAEGRFPRWHDVVPSNENAVGISCSTAQLATCVRQVQAMTDKESRSVSLTIDQGVVLCSAEGTGGNGQCQMQHGAGNTDKRYEVTLDALYLLQALQACGDQVTLSWSAEPTTIDGAVKLVSGMWCGVIMPLSVEG